MTTLSSLRRYLAEAWERFYMWKSEHQYLGRYSVEKLAAFDHYQRNASRLRVTAVILLTPLPTYIVLLIMDGAPMRDPRDGAKANGVAFARSVFSHIVMTFGVLMAVKEAVLRTHPGYSLQKLLVISVWVVVGLEFACIGTAFLWRFPVPFREVIFVPLWLFLVVGLNWYFAKEALLSRAQAMIRYIPLITTQFVFFYALLGLAMAYAVFSMTAQIILTVSFPLVRIICRRSIWRQARNIDDISTDLTMCLLEITSALYQTVSLQFAKTPVLTVVIMVSDLVQAMIEVREYLSLEYLVDSTSTLNTAVKILQGGMSSGLTERRSITAALPLGPTTGNYPEDSSSIFGPTSSIASIYVERDQVKKTNSRRLLDLKYFEDTSERSDSGNAGGDRLERCLSSPSIPTVAPPGQETGDVPSSQPKGIERQTSRRASLQSITFEYGSGDSPSRRTSLTSLRLPPLQQKRLSGGSFGRHQIHPMAENEVASSIAHEVPIETKELVSPSPSPPTTTPPPTSTPVNLGPFSRRRSTSVMIDGVAVSRKDQARILEQTLQLLFSCEVLLVSEYFEVIIPVLYAFSLLTEWYLPNAKFNMIAMGMSHTQTVSTFTNSILYAFLECISLFLMAWVIQRRYKLSVFHLLAFVLEKYWMTLQGKMVGAFIVIWNSLTVHQGVDFSFEFDYGKMLSRAQAGQPLV